jgi:hypothetical protein
MGDARPPLPPSVPKAIRFSRPSANYRRIDYPSLPTSVEDPPPGDSLFPLPSRVPDHSTNPTIALDALIVVPSV